MFERKVQSHVEQQEHDTQLRQDRDGGFLEHHADAYGFQPDAERDIADDGAQAERAAPDRRRDPEGEKYDDGNEGGQYGHVCHGFILTCRPRNADSNTTAWLIFGSRAPYRSVTSWPLPSFRSSGSAGLRFSSAT